MTISPTAPSKEHEEMLTIPQLARLLGLTPGTIYGWQPRNYGPTRIKVGRSVRYRMSDVEAWMVRQERP
jgi:predicted DNA-binding transcriptional regulator AlpA